MPGLVVWKHTHNDTYVHVVLLVKRCLGNMLAIPMIKHSNSSHMNAFGRGASVPGGWRPGGIDALVLDMRPLYVN